MLQTSEGSLRKHSKLVIATSCVAALLLLTTAKSGPLGSSAEAAGAGFKFTKIETCFMNKINAYRGKHGLNKLDADNQLGKKARNWATKMAAAKELAHPLSGWYNSITGWTIIRDNVGVGPSCKRIMKAFKNSPTHKANILWPGLKWVGVGAKRTKSGKLYVQQVFTNGDNPGL